LSTAPDNVYSVSQLNAAVRGLLDQSFPLLWVEGEISNLARPRSGHWYFTLKDEQSQVRCAMFANRNRLLRLKPADGDQVMIRARVGLYAPRGEYQLVAEHMEAAGAGALQRAFDALKQKLGDEGLFSDALKQPLPAAPRRIGVITSPTGAALRDVVSVLRRRFPMARVVLYPVPVQGDTAAAAIRRALETADRRAECDVLLLVRGGGAIEDLWCFNDEKLARALVACRLPVVAGVGHETDVTIADFAADLRAPTPSAAAELVCPDQQALAARVRDLRLRLSRAHSTHLTSCRQELQTLERRLRAMQPQKRLAAFMQQLDERESRLTRAVRGRLTQQQWHLSALIRRLDQASPKRRRDRAAATLDQLQIRLASAMRQTRDQAAQRHGALLRQLHTVSPLATLERGYAIAQTDQDRILRSAEQARPGDRIRLRLGRGELDAEVIECRPGTQYPSRRK
jgi:exodeoxyribonuclease VII large subunit